LGKGALVCILFDNCSPYVDNCKLIVDNDQGRVQESLGQEGTGKVFLMVPLKYLTRSTQKDGGIGRGSRIIR
jgi:hypothetical protein